MNSLFNGGTPNVQADNGSATLSGVSKTIEYRNGTNNTNLRFQRNIGLNWNTYVQYLNRTRSEFNYAGYAMQGESQYSRGFTGSANIIGTLGTLGTKLNFVAAGVATAAPTTTVTRRVDIFSNDYLNSQFVNYGYLHYIIT